MKLLHIASLAAATALAALSTPVSAVAVRYNLGWTGTGGYSMTGNFTFDTSAGSEVRDYEVGSLFINVLLNGASIGTWTLPAAADPDFNFNFNAVSGTFFTGGDSTGDNGQNWNYAGSVQSGFVGFVSGAALQSVSDVSSSQRGIMRDLSTLQATLDATPAAVPEPASWAMMVGGFGLVGGAMRRRTVAVAST